MKITLKNDKPETLREFVETLQHITVAPRILAEEGWNAFDIRLTDEEIGHALRAARIKPHKSFSDEQMAELCNIIDAMLLLRHMADEGLVEVTASEACDLGYRLTAAGQDLHAKISGEDAA